MIFGLRVGFGLGEGIGDVEVKDSVGLWDGEVRNVVGEEVSEQVEVE